MILYTYDWLILLDVQKYNFYFIWKFKLIDKTDEVSNIKPKPKTFCRNLNRQFESEYKRQKNNIKSDIYYTAEPVSGFLI